MNEYEIDVVVHLTARTPDEALEQLRAALDEVLPYELLDGCVCVRNFDVPAQLTGAELVAEHTGREA